MLHPQNQGPVTVGGGWEQAGRGGSCHYHTALQTADKWADSLRLVFEVVLV